jgi:hypothetical protein
LLETSGLPALLAKSARLARLAQMALPGKQALLAYRDPPARRA